MTSADGDSFAGSVKVKLGPIALVYNGMRHLRGEGRGGHRFVVDAKGKDKRGNGTAGAHVTVSMTDADGSTDVSVQTDLAITGKPAQFGRGVMQDVSDKLLGQFVACLEQRLTGGDEPDDVPQPVAAAAAPAAAVEDGPPAAEPPPPAPRPVPPRPPQPSAQPEALDLGSAVLPVLARAYWKQGVGALVVLALLWRLLRR